ncbi:hypothetical protein [Enterobacter cloacae]|uniref:hypothetical protein n=1 Tax=Enterobacter cloacae TaxID=550 RepID=UPI002A7EC64C|nr:hypothetical protein [Enterobacter cloacae]HAS1181951.1 hypothetical protein [Enterobacter cloacae]
MLHDVYLFTVYIIEANEMAIAPAPGMKVKWRDIYWPVGEWVNEDGDIVEIAGNFRAISGEDDILVIMNNQTSRGGHGDPPITSPTPSFIHAETLESLPKPPDFIELK